jgi:hypothetical protein
MREAGRRVVAVVFSSEDGSSRDGGREVCVESSHTIVCSNQVNRVGDDIRLGANRVKGEGNQVAVATRRRSLWCTPSLRSNQPFTTTEQLSPHSHRPHKRTVSRNGETAGRGDATARAHSLFAAHPEMVMLSHWSTVIAMSRRRCHSATSALAS